VHRISGRAMCNKCELCSKTSSEPNILLLTCVLVSFVDAWSHLLLTVTVNQLQLTLNGTLLIDTVFYKNSSSVYASLTLFKGQRIRKKRQASTGFEVLAGKLSCRKHLFYSSAWLSHPTDILNKKPEVCWGKDQCEELILTLGAQRG